MMKMNPVQRLLAKYLLTYYILAECQALPDLNIMGFLPMSGNLWPGGGACLPAIQIALRMANERTDILADYNLRYLYKDTKCDPGVAANRMYEMLYEQPVKHFISGPGCSLAAEATARSSHMWNLTHLSWAAASPLLSDVNKYPRFFRIDPSDAFYNKAKVALLRHFNWKKVAIINVALDYFFAVTDDLLRRIEGTEIRVIKQEIFNGNPAHRVRQLKAVDARIIFAGGYENHARQILCAAYAAGLYGPKIVWFFPQWYSVNWWRLQLHEVTCTREQMETVAEGHFETGQFSHHPNHDYVGSSGISYVDFMTQFLVHEQYKEEFSTYDGIAANCFDSTWGAALALNCTDATLKEQGHSKSLAEFDYSDVDIADVITTCTNNLHFVGMAGRADLTHRDAQAAVQISQVNGLHLGFVGIYDTVMAENGQTEWEIQWVNGGVRWRGGYVPRDSTEVKIEEYTVPVYLYVLLSCLASFGCLLSLSLFIFNLHYRENVYVKLSSPNINNILLLGCVCTYCTVFMQSYTSETIVLCKMRSFTFTIGFSLAFGALFSKTWRVYKIFSNKQLQRLNIQDRQLIGIVGLLIGVLCSVLILREIIDPVDLEITFIDSQVYFVGVDEEIRPYIRGCISRYESYFAWTIYIIEGVLLIFGAFLSFETRRVKIAALNDSRLIGLCLYNVVVLAAIGLTLTLALDTQVALIYGLTSGFIIFGTTATQLIVFIPKITAVFYPHHIEPDGACRTEHNRMTGLHVQTGQVPWTVKPSSSELTPREPTIETA